MKRIKIMLMSAMLILAMGVSAQMNFAIKGGVNMSNFYGKELNHANFKVGFNAGLALDYQLRYDMAIQSGLFFTTKGYRYDAEVLEYSDNLFYIQLPVHYAYRVNVSPGTSVILHGGPYAAYGVGGSRKIIAGTLGTLDVKTPFGDDVHQYKPFDAGLGLGVGIELSPFIIDLGWDMGLLNISNIDNATRKTQNAYLSLGFRF